MIEPLCREEVSRAIERRNPSRIPLVFAKPWGQGLKEQYGDRLNELAKYPEDVVWLWQSNPVEPKLMGLTWDWKTDGAHDSKCVIDDWAKLDEFIEKLPRPESDERIAGLVEKADKARAEGRYLLYAWWCLFFERPWQLRGMQNLMCDYYSDTENIHRLHSAMCDSYCAYLSAAVEALHPDGFWSSDDLGHQTGPMMSPEIFRDLIYPYYQRMGKAVANGSMHFWLHSCGDNTLLIPYLIDAGLTVFHPVQKHAMDEAAVADEFGDRLTFLAGIDVQHTLQEKKPAGVREEVRSLIDTFDGPNGGMCLAAGNGIVAGTPFENIEAYLDEAVKYGVRHREEVTAGHSADEARGRGPCGPVS